MQALETSRLRLVPITLGIVEAVLQNRPEEVSRLCENAALPAIWPGRALIERAFSASLDAIRSAPRQRLWGDRIAITKGVPPEGHRIVGSVIFHGRPNAEGTVELGYGVEESAQKNGFATEAVGASLAWAFTHEDVLRVRATTLPWHHASVRVLEKCGFSRAGFETHETLGDLLVFELTRSSFESLDAR